MVPHVGPTKLLEILSTNSHLEDSLATAALTISFILASVFDMSFRTVSIAVLILTLPSTRLIVSLIFSSVRLVLFSARSLVERLCLVISSTSLFQAVAHYLVKATPILLLIVLIILATWSTLSGFYPCDVPEPTAPSTPRGPPRRSPMSFRRARGIPVLKLPSDHTPTPFRERERRYLEIIDARDAKIARRAKRIEKLALRLNQAREVVAVQDATIAERERTISENAAALAERERTIAEGADAMTAKDAIIARLTEDVERLRSDNTDALSMLSKKSAHISDLCFQLATADATEEGREAAIDALHAKVAALEADLSAAQADAVALRAASSSKTTISLEDTIAAREASAVVQKDGLVASLHAEILKLQRELDLLHCRIVEREALLATQTATIDDLREERDAAIRSAGAQTQLVEHLTPVVATYEREAAHRSLAKHHLPPASSDGLETCTVTLDANIRSLAQQLAAAQQEALDATRLQKAYEEVADAGAVRVIELVQQLEEQKELSEVDRELFLVRIRKLTALLDKARLGIPVPDKAFAQLRLPANTGAKTARTEDIFTAVTPRIPAYTESPTPSTSPSLSLSQNERKLRRRSAIENLRQPLADVTASATANSVPLGRQAVPRSRLPRPSSISIPITTSQSPPAVNERRPDIPAS